MALRVPRTRTGTTPGGRLSVTTNIDKAIDALSLFERDLDKTQAFILKSKLELRIKDAILWRFTMMLGSTPVETGQMLSNWLIYQTRPGVQPFAPFPKDVYNARRRAARGGYDWRSSVQPRMREQFREELKNMKIFEPGRKRVVIGIVNPTPYIKYHTNRIESRPPNGQRLDSPLGIDRGRPHPGVNPRLRWPANKWDTK